MGGRAGDVKHHKIGLNGRKVYGLNGRKVYGQGAATPQARGECPGMVVIVL